MKLPYLLTNKISWLVLGLALIAVVLGLTLRSISQPVSPAELVSVEVLARDTGSAQVWRVFEDERAHGLTAAGAARVREAAKATPPPYGLLSDR